ncbi:MAG: hypothetical protein AAFZ09_14670, partial [Pseudomonadota bacterium]
MIDDDLMIVLAGATVTALATGLGALPFLVLRDVGARLLGLSNAVAAGLMLAASHSLMVEGGVIDLEFAVIGALAGLAAIVASDRWLSGHGGGQVAAGVPAGGEPERPERGGAPQLGVLELDSDLLAEPFGDLAGQQC